MHVQLEIKEEFNLLYQNELTGNTVSNIRRIHGKSRKTNSKWKYRYKQKEIEFLFEVSRRPHNIKYWKITLEV